MKRKHTSSSIITVVKAVFKSATPALLYIFMMQIRQHSQYVRYKRLHTHRHSQKLRTQYNPNHECASRTKLSPEWLGEHLHAASGYMSKTNTGPFTAGQPHMINDLQLRHGWQVSWIHTALPNPTRHPLLKIIFLRLARTGWLSPTSTTSQTQLSSLSMLRKRRSAVWTGEGPGLLLSTPPKAGERCQLVLQVLSPWWSSYIC